MSSIDLARHLVSSAKRVVVFSGAGLSAESGIPTYRDSGGLWTDAENLQFATASGLRSKPREALEWFNARRQQMRLARPNAAHLTLSRHQSRAPQTTHITQNIDGLLSKAGCHGVIELHGNITRDRCAECGLRPAPRRFFAPTKCRCGGILRPDVVLFDELLDEDTLMQARVAAAQSDVFVTIGTSGMVYPAADLPAQAIRFGAKLVVINLEETLLGKAADVEVVGPAGVVVPAILAAPEH